MLFDQQSTKTAVAVISALGLLTLALNFSVFSANWRWDDPSILLHIHRYGFWQDFLSPAVWQEFSPSNLTPWLSISFETDLILFGLRPGYFYAHQLLALVAVATMLYYTLRLWVRPYFALLGAGLFLLGTPTLLVAQQLMTRHYIEGAVFCLASLICFVLYLRQQKLSLLLLSAGAYLLAATAKEVYLPLLVLLIFLPEQDFRFRLKSALPHVAVALLYTLWRGYMLENLGGGYTASESILAQLGAGDIFSALFSFPLLLFGSFWSAALIIYVNLLLAYCFMTRSRLLLVILTALLILLPMIPLVSFPGISIADRYLFLPWLGFSFSVAFFADRLHQSLPAEKSKTLNKALYAMLAIVLLVSLLPAMRVRSTVAEYGREFDVQGDFIWKQDEQVAFLPSGILLASYWFVTDLVQFKQGLQSGSSAPLPVIDPVLHTTSVANIWRYDSDCGCMLDTGDSLAAQRQQQLARVDSSAPLTLDYEYSAGYFDWRFGPYTAGQYHVVSEQLGLLPAPQSGRLRVNIAPGTEFTLRYTAPEGWLSYSDPQRIEPNGQRVFWER